MTLDHREEAFVRDWMTGNYSVTDCYLRHYEKGKRNTKQVASAASRLFLKPEIAERIKELRQPAADRITVTAAEMLQELVTIAFADPAELIRYRWVNCRHCNGVDHKYQWRDSAEYWRALEQAAKAEEARIKKPGSAPIPMPSDEGGYGFRANAAPHAHCPYCDGEGHREVFVPDTLTMSPRARKLYAGVKQTKNGIEVLMRDQDAAMKMLCQVTGLLVEKLNLGGTVGVAAGTVQLTPEQAAAVAKAMLEKI